MRQKTSFGILKLQIGSPEWGKNAKLKNLRTPLMMNDELFGQSKFIFKS